MRSAEFLIKIKLITNEVIDFPKNLAFCIYMSQCSCLLVFVGFQTLCDKFIIRLDFD
jgi:hypothetical protein